MTIQTKFDIGDTVYFVREDKLQKREVQQIEIYADKEPLAAQPKTLIRHTVSWNGGYDRIEESLLFGTAQEAVNSLLSK